MALHAVRRQVLRLHFIFVANVFTIVIVARWLPIRLCGEPRLRFGVRLSDDCYRSLGVWAEGIVKTRA